MNEVVANWRDRSALVVFFSIAGLSTPTATDDTSDVVDDCFDSDDLICESSMHNEWQAKEFGNNNNEIANNTITIVVVPTERFGRISSLSVFVRRRAVDAVPDVIVVVVVVGLLLLLLLLLLSPTTAN